MDPIAGLPCIGSTLRTCSGWPWKQRLRVYGCTGLATRVSRLRDIASVIGQRLHLPVVGMTAEDVGSHFGWLAAFASIDSLASSALTQQWLRWHPVQPGLIADLEESHSFKNV